LIYNKINIYNLITKNLQGGAKSAFFAQIGGKNFVDKIFLQGKSVFTERPPLKNGYKVIVLIFKQLRN